MPARSVLRTLVTAGAVAALGIPGASYAETFTHRDATHDVQQYRFDSGDLTNARHNKGADIVKTRLTYDKQGLTSTVWLRSGTIGDVWLFGGQLKTDSSRFDWLASVSPKGKSVVLHDHNGDPVACDGITRDVARHKGRVSVTIPKPCLGKPDWIKASAAFAIDRGSTSQFADDGLQKRGLTEDPVFQLSHKLHRG